MSDWTSCPCCDGDGGMTSGSYPDHEVRGGQYRATPATMVALCGAVLTCALPILHDGDHERADGIRWTWPAAPAPPVTLSHGQGSGNDTVILRNSLTIHATPAPLDVEREALRRQHLEETHRASGSCPGWTCPTARVLTALAPGDES